MLNFMKTNVGKMEPVDVIDAKTNKAKERTNLWAGWGGQGAENGASKRSFLLFKERSCGKC